MYINIEIGEIILIVIFYLCWICFNRVYFGVNCMLINIYIIFFVRCFWLCRFIILYCIYIKKFIYFVKYFNLKFYISLFNMMMNF